MIDFGLLKDVWIQLVATFLGTLLCLANGMAYGWTSPMIPYFTSPESHIPITHAEGDWFETLIFVGAACGLPGTVFVVDFFGRRGSTILAAVLCAVCWLMTLFGTHIYVIYAARFFFGMGGNMCFISVPMYIAEIADSRIRGFLSTCSYLMMLTGILVVYSTGALLPYYVAPTIGVILSVCEFVFFPFMPESPYYYLHKGQEEKAKKALQRLRTDPVKTEQEFREIKKAIERQLMERGRPRDLFEIPSNRKGVLISLLLNTAQHFIGISVMLMNVHIILQDAGSIYMSPSTAAIIFAVTMLIGACIASTIIDRFGRKFLIITSAVATGIALVILATYFQIKNTGYDVSGVSWIPLACVMTYAATFKTGMGIVPIVIVGEIFPTTVKAMGMTLADVFYVIAGIASLNIFSWTFETFGMQVPMYLFSLCSFTAAVSVYFYIPETKGKTLDEIQLMLKGHSEVEEKLSCEDVTRNNVVV
ncbi:facilitated trehalose transporter Tret1-like [Anthonomus grandis grandis]|uniref:facilitated trehalose transporter Tret1-like n=1 Tax=Anthonomus grandis grandis TaxID=2921223 RepID=UPI002165CE58|nr:facilitated trehalose transporter Tret1-like [Anthonomus grandis grandis]